MLGRESLDLIRGREGRGGLFLTMINMLIESFVDFEDIVGEGDDLRNLNRSFCEMSIKHED